MGMMGALMTPLLAVSLPWATPSPQPTVTVTQTASPVPSASGITAEQVAEVQHSFWFKALQWFLGVPLQILIVVVVTIIVIGVSHRLIDRTVKKISDREAEVDEEEEPDRVRRDREQFGEALLNQRRTQRASAIGSLLRSIVTAVAVGIAILTILPFLGINIGPLLTSAGVLGVALGFGAQNLVKDYLSGIYIVLEDQYGVGDMVEVGSVVGRVEEVTLRVTRLRDQTGVVWYIRNGEILTVANRSQGWTLAFADIPIAADVDLERVRAAVATVAEQMMADPELDDSLLDEPATRVSSRCPAKPSWCGWSPRPHPPIRLLSHASCAHGSSRRSTPTASESRRSSGCQDLRKPLPAGRDPRDEAMTTASEVGAGIAKLCLVTGATGYIGGRLVPELLAAGYRVRVLSRHPERLRDVDWFDDVEVVQGDAADPIAIAAALAAVDVAYYLLHSLQLGEGFEDVERDMAKVFGQAAEQAGVRRLVYLGGLTPAARPRSSARTCALAPRLDRSCVTPACRQRNCARRSSSARDRPVSRCCAT